MIKIAHIATIDGSLGSLLLNQMLSIREAGYDVLGIASPGPGGDVVAAAGIQRIPVPMTRSISPVADLGSLWRLYRVIRRERFTIVHTHNPKPGLLGQLAARMAGTPIVVNTLHGLYFHDQTPPAQRRFYVALEKIAAYCSDVILSQNAEDIQTVIQEGICGPEKIKYLGNGIDLTQFDPDRIPPDAVRQKRAALGLTDGAPVVGFVGRLAARRKGFLDFLAAGQRVLQQMPRARLLVVGDAHAGHPDAVSPEVAADYGIADACIFLGWRPNEELPLLYALMDVLVLPSLFEGVPRAVMEAAAMGVPAVVTDVKGNREAVTHDHNGLLVPLGDVPRLAQAIQRILAGRPQARRMGENGRHVAAERFDERRVFERVKAEYARLLREKGLNVPEPRAVVHSGAPGGLTNPG